MEIEILVVLTPLRKVVKGGFMEAETDSRSVGYTRR